MVNGILLFLFFVVHCDFAVDACFNTDGIERSQLEQVVVEPLLGRNTWTQDHILSGDVPAIKYFYNWHVYDKYGDSYPVG